MNRKLPAVASGVLIAIFLLVIGFLLWRNSQPAPTDPNNLPPFLQLQKEREKAGNAAPSTPVAP